MRHGECLGLLGPNGAGVARVRVRVRTRVRVRVRVRASSGPMEQVWP